MSFPSLGQIIFMFDMNPETGEITEYKTRLVDESTTEFFLEIPVNVLTNESSYVELGKKFKLEYVLKSGTRCFFDAEVNTHVKKNIQMMVITKPQLHDIKEVQRRNFFRIEIDVEIAMQRQDFTRKVYNTDDIGGGGVSFVAGPSDQFEPDEVLDCWILLPYRNGTVDNAHFKAQVIRVKEGERGHKIVMLRYLDIQESERQRIIRFSFAKQIEFKDRGINF